MSYPLLIRPLIIEDHLEAKEAYAKIFAKLSLQSPWKYFAPITPCFALSYEDGIAMLKQSIAFHLVILDLELPRTAGRPAQAGVDFGTALLDKCLGREEFPVPSVLIISGHIDKIEQSKLRNRVSSGCYYGNLLTKGTLALLEEEIVGACEHVLRYCAVGIHIRDSGEAQYPGITPREEDLLRRESLSKKGQDVIGVDLSWWSAQNELGPNVDPSWTKVLLGRHILAEGHGASIPRFFKLFPGANAGNVTASARQVESHLAHMRIVGEVLSPSRALLVTENAVGSLARPVSLASYLQIAERTNDWLNVLIGEIVAQLQTIGLMTPDAQCRKDFLWKWHNVSSFEEQLSRCPIGDWEGELFRGSIEPHVLLSNLLIDQQVVHCSKRTLVHGDVNLTNIALSNSESGPNAFLIDPASTVGPAPIERDLASLEVSALLHQVIDREDMMRLCRNLYGGGFLGSSDLEYRSVVARNTGILIRALRVVIDSRFDKNLYSLFLFDYAAIQVSGLVWGSATSKICEPHSAALVARAVTTFYLAVEERHAGAE